MGRAIPGWSGRRGGMGGLSEWEVVVYFFFPSSFSFVSCLLLFFCLVRGVGKRGCGCGC